MLAEIREFVAVDFNYCNPNPNPIDLLWSESESKKPFFLRDGDGVGFVMAGVDARDGDCVT